MEEEKLRAVYYARCSTEEENQKDALVRQAACGCLRGEPLRYEPEGQTGI